MDEKIAKRLVIHGRVQGVWFRQSTKDAAEAAGAAGWVRNRSDGTVEAHVEGSDAAVRQVVEFCQTGPPAAQVDEVEQMESAPEGLRGFEIRR